MITYNFLNAVQYSRSKSVNAKLQTVESDNQTGDQPQLVEHLFLDD